MSTCHSILAVSFTALALNLGIAPEGALAQRPGGGGPMMRMNSVEYLLTQGEQLGLNDEQTKALEKIAADLTVETEPLRDEMRAAREGGGGRDAMMPLMEKMRGADEKAVSLAMEILNDAQRESATKALADRPRGRGPGGG